MGLPISITCFVLTAGVLIIQGFVTVECLTAVGLVMAVIEQLNFSWRADGGILYLYCQWFNCGFPCQRRRFLVVR